MGENVGAKDHSLSSDNSNTLLEDNTLVFGRGKSFFFLLGNFRGYDTM